MAPCEEGLSILFVGTLQVLENHDEVLPEPSPVRRDQTASASPHRAGSPAFHHLPWTLSMSFSTAEDQTWTQPDKSRMTPAPSFSASNTPADTAQDPLWLQPCSPTCHKGAQHIWGYSCRKTTAQEESINAEQGRGKGIFRFPHCSYPLSPESLMKTPKLRTGRFPLRRRSNHKPPVLAFFDLSKAYKHLKIVFPFIPHTILGFSRVFTHHEAAKPQFFSFFFLSC